MSDPEKCPVCKGLKSFESFLSKDGRRQVKTCIDCRERISAWKGTNQERCVASRRRNAEKANSRSSGSKARRVRIGDDAHREEQRRYQAKWLSNPKNRVKRQAAVSRWMSANRLKMNAAYKRWYIRNQDALRLQAHQRAEVYGKSDFSVEDWEEILISFNYCCGYCLRGDVELTMDHMTPISMGGMHEASNIIAACRSCNSSKGDRSMLLMARKSTRPGLEGVLNHGI